MVVTEIGEEGQKEVDEKFYANGKNLSAVRILKKEEMQQK